MSQGLSKGVMIAIAARAIRIPMGAAEDTSTAQVRGRGGLVPAGSFAVSTEERKPLMQKCQEKIGIRGTPPRREEIRGG
jgi:hypothetical protein